MSAAILLLLALGVCHEQTVIYPGGLEEAGLVCPLSAIKEFRAQPAQKESVRG